MKRLKSLSGKYKKNFAYEELRQWKLVAERNTDSYFEFVDGLS